MKRLALVAVVCIVATALVMRFFFVPDPVVSPGETVYLPSGVKIVTVQEDTEETVGALAAERLRSANLEVAAGELRDELGRLVRVIQTLSVDTGPVESPEPEVITKIIKQACEDNLVPLGRAQLVDAMQFEGMNETTGNVERGWTGSIRCEMATYRDTEWGLLVDEPFRLSNTVATAIAPPRPPAPAKRWFAGVHWAAARDGAYVVASSYPAKFRLYAGRRWMPERKFAPRTGVFVDSGAAGVDVGVDW